MQKEKETIHYQNKTEPYEFINLRKLAEDFL